MGYKKDSPAKRTGVKAWCPFVLLYLFSVVWDVLPDMMHILKGILHAHLFPLVVSKRHPNKPKPLPAEHKDGTPYTEEEMEGRSARNAENEAEYELAIEVSHILRASFITCTQVARESKQARKLRAT